MSADGPRSRTGSPRGLGSGRRSEALRLALAAALAAGVVVLAESLGGGHHRSGRPAATSAGQLASGPGARALRGSASAGSVSSSSHAPAGAGVSAALASSGGSVAVAAGPAVTRSLRHGLMNVVIDEPSSSAFAEQNRLIAQGAEVAVDQLNASGGLTARRVHVNLVHQRLDALSATAVRSRLRAAEAAVLILPCDTDSQLALAAGAAPWGLLMLAPCNPDPAAGQRYPTYWPVGTSATDEASGLAKFMSLYGYLSAYVISTPGSRYFELLTSYFRAAAQKRGIELTGAASVSTSTRDFSGLARAIESAPTSAAIFAAAPPALAANLAAALRAHGVERPIAGSVAMDAPRTIARGTGALENAFFPSNGFPRDDASARRFARDYTRRFRSAPAGSFPGLGLETIRLLKDAVSKAGSAEPSAIQWALAEGIALHGVGLADRVYENGGNHNPVGQVDISKVSSRGLAPLVAITLP